jgi:spore coat polysaccharide biosynthesis protein SpsF (cytidylyltransferase family)
MRVVAIIQARLNSSRLPGKMLLPLLEKPLIQHVIERTRHATRLDLVVLAYPLRDNEAFRAMLTAFRGTPGEVAISSYADSRDENDLVGRYLSAAHAYDADIIVRIPGDNPCVDPAYIDKAVTEYAKRPYTFYSNTTALVSAPTKKPTRFDSGKRAYWVDGVGAEVFSLSRLKWLDEQTQSRPTLREHPHQYFYELSGSYWEHEHDGGIHIEQTEFSEIRLDVNEQKDYAFVNSIFDHFGHNRFTAAEIVAYLESKKVPV